MKLALYIQQTNYTIESALYGFYSLVAKQMSERSE